MWRCARLLGRDPVAAIVLVGLNPIVLLWGLGGDHNDFFTVFFIVLAFYLLLRARAPGISPALDARSRSPPGTGCGRSSPLRRCADPPGAGAWLLAPLASLELAAGAALATAIALKASAGILVPVVLAGLLRAPRRLVRVVLGIVVAGESCSGCARVAAFGAHLPDLGTQGRLVIPMSLPNVLGLALGQGGETDTMRSAAQRGCWRCRCSAAACWRGAGGTR